MKKKIISIITICIMLLSICFNIYFLLQISESRKQIAVFSSQVIVADDQINDLNSKLSDFEDLQNEILVLQSQLADSNKQIKTLESSLAESEIEIQDLKNVIAENETTINSLIEQQEKTTPQSQINSNPSSNGNIPTHSMPGTTFGGAGFDGNPTGTGTGTEITGSFGTYE